ncbi:MAG: ribbon-helix-helix domain-containing protein [Nanoarchaeota archaeon]
MESITIKVDEKMAREIEKAMDPLYATKTEFIREAIRGRIEEIQKQRALALLRKNFGAAKTKTPLEDDEKIREEAGRELAKKYGFNLD